MLTRFAKDAAVAVLIALIALISMDTRRASADFRRDQILKVQELLISAGYSAVRLTGTWDDTTSYAQVYACHLQNCEIDNVRATDDLTPVIKALENILAHRRVFDQATLELVSSPDNELQTRLSSNGELLVTYDGSQLAVWDRQKGARRSAVPVKTLASSRDDRILMDDSGTLVALADSAITIVNIETGNIVGWVPARDLRNGSAAERKGFDYFDKVEARFIPGTTRILAVRSDGAVVLLDWKSGEFVRTILPTRGSYGAGSKNVEVSPDGKFASTISPQEKIARIWELGSFNQIASVQHSNASISHLITTPRHFVYSTFVSGKQTPMLAFDFGARKTLSSRLPDECKDKAFLNEVGASHVVRITAGAEDTDQDIKITERRLDCSEAVVVSLPKSDLCKKIPCSSYTDSVRLSSNRQTLAIPGERSFALVKLAEAAPPGAAGKDAEMSVQEISAPQSIAGSGVVSDPSGNRSFAVFSAGGKIVPIDTGTGSPAQQIQLGEGGLIAVRSLPGGRWVGLSGDGHLLMGSRGQPDRTLQINDEKSHTADWWKLFIINSGQHAVVVGSTTKAKAASESILVDLRAWRVVRRDLIKAVLPFEVPMQGAVWAGTAAAMVGNTTYLAVSVHEPVIQIVDVMTGRRIRQVSTAAKDVILADDLREFAAKGSKYRDIWSPYSLHSAGERGLLINAGFSGFRNLIDGLSFILPDATADRPRGFQLGASYTNVAVSSDGQSAFVGFDSGKISAVSLATGAQIQKMADSVDVRELALSLDGQRLAALTKIGETRIYDTASGKYLVNSVSFTDGEWIVRTPQGYFDGSPLARQRILIRTSPNTVTPIDNAFNALYRPELVRSALANDAATTPATLEASQILTSGAAPRVAIVTPAGNVGSDEAVVEAEIAERNGGGIGRIEWRVNGVTLGVESRGMQRLPDAAASAASPSRPPVVVKRTLALEPGENRIEVIAYNGRDLIASDPARVVLNWDGEKSATPPKLHVLAVGVNDYYDSRLRLSYAVPDARALGEALKQAGGSLYQSVEVISVLDDKVTVDNLDQVFADLGSKVHPRDVFVFFLAGHGKTVDGRYHFLPQNFRYEDESSIVKRGIDQERFQAWFAKIPARKSILLYDTCESGSLTGDRVQQRGIERVAALEKMTRAMGRTVLSASSDDAPALEGYKGHGVFTYALLDGLQGADTNGNGLIEVTELAAYVDQKVPDLSYQAFKLRQIPQMKIVGSSFPVVSKASVLQASDAASPPGPMPTKPTHVVISSSPVDVYVAAARGGAVVQQLPPGTTVTLIEGGNGWQLVAKDGKKLGFVEERALLKLQ